MGLVSGVEPKPQLTQENKLEVNQLNQVSVTIQAHR